MYQGPDVEIPLKERERARELAVLHSTAAVLFAAMSVEAFLNLYGVFYLTQAFHAANTERLSPHQKVAILLRAKQGVTISPSSEIVQVTRDLFEQRNGLVHPKTKELYSRTVVVSFDPTEGHVETARKALRLMERFFELFLTLDPEASTDIRLIRMSHLTSTRVVTDR